VHELAHLPLNPAWPAGLALSVTFGVSLRGSGKLEKIESLEHRRGA
jgi:hypothetical protein